MFVLCPKERYEALEELVINNLQALLHDADGEEYDTLKKYEILLTSHRATPEDWLEAIALVKL